MKNNLCLETVHCLSNLGFEIVCCVFFFCQFDVFWWRWWFGTWILWRSTTQQERKEILYEESNTTSTPPGIGRVTLSKTPCGLSGCHVWSILKHYYYYYYCYTVKTLKYTCNHKPTILDLIRSFQFVWWYLSVVIQYGIW